MHELDLSAVARWVDSGLLQIVGLVELLSGEVATDEGLDADHPQLLRFPLGENLVILPINNWLLWGLWWTIQMVTPCHADLLVSVLNRTRSLIEILRMSIFRHVVAVERAIVLLITHFN